VTRRVGRGEGEEIRGEKWSGGQGEWRGGGGKEVGGCKKRGVLVRESRGGRRGIVNRGGGGVDVGDGGRLRAKRGGMRGLGLRSRRRGGRVREEIEREKGGDTRSWFKRFIPPGVKD